MRPVVGIRPVISSQSEMFVKTGCLIDRNINGNIDHKKIQDRNMTVSFRRPTYIKMK